MANLTELTAQELLSDQRIRSLDMWAEIRRRLERLEQCEADTKILDWLEEYSSFSVATFTESGKTVKYIDGGAGTAMHTSGSSLRDAVRSALEES